MNDTGTTSVLSECGNILWQDNKCVEYIFIDLNKESVFDDSKKLTHWDVLDAEIWH
jgi:hypothetical protein